MKIAFSKFLKKFNIGEPETLKQHRAVPQKMNFCHSMPFLNFHFCEKNFMAFHLNSEKKPSCFEIGALFVTYMASEKAHQFQN